MPGGNILGGAIRVGQWLGKGYRGLRGLVPARWRGHDWSFLPLIPGKWRDLAPRDAMQLMARYAASCDPTPWACREGDVLAVRVLPLTCVKQGLLVEYDVAGHYDAWRGIAAFIWLPNRFIPLDGTAFPFHKLNEEGALELTTAAPVVQFVQLFCAALNGNSDGFVADSFVPMRRGFPIHVNTAHPHFAKAMQGIATAPEAMRDGKGGWRVTMPIAYGSNFFLSTFRTGPGKLIDMETDEGLFGVIPAVTLRWIDGVRRVYPANMAELETMPGDRTEEDDA